MRAIATVGSRKRRIAMHLIAGGITLTLGVSVVHAQAVPLTGSLPPGRLDPNDVIVNKRPPVPHRPFDLIDPKTRRKVGPNAMIILPSGKEVQAGPYYAELSRLEQEFNKLGYSFRDEPNRPPDQLQRVIPLQQHRMDAQRFQQQDDLLKRSHPIGINQNVPIPLERMPQLNLQFQQGLQAALIAPRGTEGPATAEEIKAFREYQEQAVKDRLLAERIEADRELGVEAGESDYQEAAKKIDEQVRALDSQQVTSRSVDSIGEGERDEFSGWRETQRRLSESVSSDGDVSSRAIVKQVVPQGIRASLNAYQIHKNQGFDWPGGNFWFGANVRGKMTLDTYPTMVSTHGDFAVAGTVVGSDFSLLNGEATVTVPQSGAMTAVAKLSIVGTTIMNINKNQTLAWGETSSPTRPFNKSTPPLTIWLGPVPLRVIAGIQGSSGMQYTIGFQPVRAYVSLGPTLDVNAYAQADIGANLILVEAHAGVRGTLLLLKEQLVGQADAALKLLNGAWVYQVTFVIYNDIRMLDGLVLAFVSIGHPCFPRVWRWCTDEFTDTFFNWTGIHAVGYLVNQQATANVYGPPMRTTGP